MNKKEKQIVKSLKNVLASKKGRVPCEGRVPMARQLSSALMESSRVPWIQRMFKCGERYRLANEAMDLAIKVNSAYWEKKAKGIRDKITSDTVNMDPGIQSTPTNCGLSGAAYIP